MLEIRRLKESVNPDEIFYVADGMSGQDAINSVKVFNNVIPLTGNLLTKMDGDSRGGAALSICSIQGFQLSLLEHLKKSMELKFLIPKGWLIGF